MSPRGFSGGKFNGQGTITFADGNKYVGKWKDGRKHGHGTYTYADGRVKKGIWENKNFLYVKNKY